MRAPPHTSRRQTNRFDPARCRFRNLWVSNCEFSRGFPDWATLRGAWPLAYADSRMKDFLLILLHLGVVAAKLCGHGGVRSVMAENLVLSNSSSSFGMVASGRPA